MEAIEEILKVPRPIVVERLHFIIFGILGSLPNRSWGLPKAGLICLACLACNLPVTFLRSDHEMDYPAV